MKNVMISMIAAAVMMIFFVACGDVEVEGKVRCDAKTTALVGNICKATVLASEGGEGVFASDDSETMGDICDPETTYKVGNTCFGIRNPDPAEYVPSEDVGDRETVCVRSEWDIEICDGTDNDCDDETDEDDPQMDEECHDVWCEGEICAPTKGHLICVEGRMVCSSICYAETDVETECDGFDNDCDGVADEGCLPIEEICDGEDNNGDGEVDEGFRTGGCYRGEGVCYREGVMHCQPDGTNECTDEATGLPLEEGEPSEEVCDGVDNNCDGEVDEGCPEQDLPAPSLECGAATMEQDGECVNAVPTMCRSECASEGLPGNVPAQGTFFSELQAYTCGIPVEMITPFYYATYTLYLSPYDTFLHLEMVVDIEYDGISEEEFHDAVNPAMTKSRADPDEFLSETVQPFMYAGHRVIFVSEFDTNNGHNLYDLMVSFSVFDKTILDKGLTFIRITDVEFKMTDGEGKEVVDISRVCMDTFDTTGIIE